MKTHLGLYTDLYELTMMQGYFLEGRADEPATFDYFFRKNPFGSAYTVFAGLSDLLEAIPQVTFSQKDLDYLQTQGFTASFLQYLEQFQFSGEIYSVEEGTIVFPEEPVLNVRGGLAESQLLETIVLNMLNFQSLIATKAARIRWAAGDKTFIDFGLRRAQGWAGTVASKAAIIGGADATSNVMSARAYGIPASGTMAHSWIQSYENEYEAFRQFVTIYGEKSILLVDTYDTIHSGIPNAIKVANETAEKGVKIKGVRLDSGDLDQLSREARKLLDEAGLHDLIIVVSNQQDEHTIHNLLKNGAPIDGFGVGTNLIVGRPDAALDGVYKLAQVNEKPTLKLSETVEKITIPGNKQLGRFYNQNGQIMQDAIVLDKENDQPGQLYSKKGESVSVNSNHVYKLLTKQVMNNGKALHAAKSAKEIASVVQSNLTQLPQELKKLEESEIYQTGISPQLLLLMQNEIAKQKEVSYGRTNDR